MSMLTDASRRALEWIIEAFDAQGFKEGVRAASYARDAYPATSQYETSRRRGGKKRAAGVVFARLHRLGYLRIIEWQYGVPLYAPTDVGRQAIQQIREAEAQKLSEAGSTLTA